MQFDGVIARHWSKLQYVLFWYTIPYDTIIHYTLLHIIYFVIQLHSTLPYHGVMNHCGDTMCNPVQVWAMHVDHVTIRYSGLRYCGQCHATVSYSEQQLGIQGNSAGFEQLLKSMLAVSSIAPAHKTAHMEAIDHFLCLCHLTTSDRFEVVLQYGISDYIW